VLLVGIPVLRVASPAFAAGGRPPRSAARRLRRSRACANTPVRLPAAPALRRGKPRRKPRLLAIGPTASPERRRRAAAHRRHPAAVAHALDQRRRI
jgi:hypothetical protein